MRRGQLESNLLILVTLGLVAFGLVMVYSATSAAEAIGGGDPIYYFKRQGIYAALGVGLLLLASRTSFRHLRPLAVPLLVTAFALCVAVLVIGHEVNGARRWLTFGPAVFQPSELAKLAVAVFAAAYLAGRRPPRTLGEILKPVGAVAGVFCGLILIEPDLGTAVAIAVMLGALLLVTGTPLQPLAAAATIASALAVAAVWAEPYRRERFFSFLDPWQDAQGAGFQIVQATIGLGSGGVLGRGLGEGVAKIEYLPEAHTDMIFAVIGEELGLVGSLAVLAGFTAFAYAGLSIALACRDPFGKRLAAALTALICGQAAINLAAVLGIAPLTGIPLPFVSYGGSSLVVGLTAVGILLNIASDDGAAGRGAVSDRGGGNGGTRDAVARRRAGARRAGSERDVRRVAGSRRSASGS